MLLTKEQISEQMRKHAEKKNGLHDLLEIMLESMMVAERGEFLSEHAGNKGNGYRPGHSYGQGKKLEFRIPRDAFINRSLRHTSLHGTDALRQSFVPVARQGR